MPNRILKESICVSASVDKLDWFEEVLFYRLIVNVDDYGRLDARPAVLRAWLFPLRDIPLAKIEAALVRLQETGCVTLYEVDGAPYLCLPSWDKHQRVRTKRDKYPAPPSSNTVDKPSATNCKTENANCKSSATNCKTASADCCPNPIQSESESISESESNPPDGDAGNEEERLFEEFWAAYPRKHKRYETRQAWQTIAPDAALAARIVAAVRTAARSEQWQRAGGRFVPYPRRYLEEHRWEDDPPPPPAGIPSTLDTAAMDELARRYTPRLGQ